MLSQCLSWKEIQNFTKETFSSPPDVKHPVGLNLFPLLWELLADCLQAGCQRAAAGLYKISTEYFDGGQYHQPTQHMFQVLSGHKAHTDSNENNFGHPSQQLRQELMARLQAVYSKVAMHANDTIYKVRNSSKLLVVVVKTRKLEREESLQTIKVQLAPSANLCKPHLSELREAAARCHNKRLQKEQQILEDVHQNGVVKTVPDITFLPSSVTVPVGSPSRGGDVTV